jgi:hypothetical protein
MRRPQKGLNATKQSMSGMIGRSRRIRTSDPRLPKTVLYQTELYSDASRGL